LRLHGVSFELATAVFKEPFAIEFLDDREDYGEPRFIIIGMAEGSVLLRSLRGTRGADSHHLSSEDNAA
jgi:uncharacterized DUF497 family protein